jgi:hypothetical protein
MALNAKLSFVWKASGTIFEIDILADQLSRWFLDDYGYKKEILIQSFKVIGGL